MKGFFLLFSILFQLIAGFNSLNLSKTKVCRKETNTETHEILSKRTVESKSFTLEDGTIKTIHYNYPIHFWDENGFQENDNSLFLEGLNYKNVQAQYQVSIPKTLNSLSFDTLSFKGEKINLKRNLIHPVASYSTEGIVQKDLLSGKEFSQIAFALNDGTEYLENISPDSFSSMETITTKSSEPFNFSVCLSTKLPLVLSKGIYYFLSSYGMQVFCINAPIISDLSGVTVPMTLLSVQKNNEDYQFDYSINDLSSYFSSYPLLLQNSVSFSIEQSALSIQDKDYIVGQPMAFENNYLHIGKSPYTMMGIGGQRLRPSFRSIVKLNFVSSLSASLITSGVISYSNYSGNVSIYPRLKEITSEPIFSQIDGTTSYTTGNEISHQGNTGFAYDVTQIIKNALYSGKSSVMFEFSFSLDSIPETVFYSSRSNSNRPTFTLTSPEIADSLYGNAGDYYQENSININCFGYASGIDSFLQLLFYNGTSVYPNNTNYVDASVYQSVFVPAALSRMAQNNIDARIISVDNNYIFDYERRIAFRIGNISQETYHDFHFMKQLSNGRWAQKHGSLPSQQEDSGVTPETSDVWNIGTYVYDSLTTYFAISQIG
ncbi:MAG: hypothetical protein LKM30_03045 [Bacilli bacterium]|jgi:hypothetical protein|nr:hypothetical protein [Bacilli bacterium]